MLFIIFIKYKADPGMPSVYMRMIVLKYISNRYYILVHILKIKIKFTLEMNHSYTLQYYYYWSKNTLKYIRFQVRLVLLIWICEMIILIIVIINVPVVPSSLISNFSIPQTSYVLFDIWNYSHSLNFLRKTMVILFCL